MCACEPCWLKVESTLPPTCAFATRIRGVAERMKRITVRHLPHRRSAEKERRGGRTAAPTGDPSDSLHARLSVEHVRNADNLVWSQVAKAAIRGLQKSDGGGQACVGRDHGHGGTGVRHGIVPAAATSNQRQRNGRNGWQGVEEAQHLQR